MKDRKVLDHGFAATGEKGAEGALHRQRQAQEDQDGSAAVVKDDKGYFFLRFQCGPVRQVGTNGTTIETVINFLVQRLKGFQKGSFACDENEAAIAALEQARNYLEQRTRDRQARGVEGTDQP